MQEHQLGDVFHQLVGIPQREQSLTRHPRSDNLVMVEAHTLRPETARARLADVVQERGEPQPQARRRVGDDRDGVSQHVLVVVDRILLELHRVQLR